MKRSLRIICIAFILIVLTVVVPFAITADGFSGWRVDGDGVERYYKNGEFVTGVCEINGFPYEFGNDGAYIGLYDSHTGVGKLNVAGSAEYESALKALGGSKIIGYYPMDAGESYKSANYKESNLWGLGAQNPAPSKNQVNSNIYTKNDVYTATDKGYFTEIQRYTSNEIVERGEGDRALHVVGTTTGGTESLHTYVSAITANALVAEETVIDCEFKLDDDFNYGSSLIQLIDRKNLDTAGNAFHQILTVNSEGGVYINNDRSALLCVLNTREYTRISVAIHPMSNTMDFYVNGVLVKSGFTYIPSSAALVSENYQIDEVRLTQISAVNGGGMYVDNVAIYRANAPVCVDNTNMKNGVRLEGGVLRYYENGLIAIGSREISGEFCGVTYDRERVNFGTVNEDGGAEIGAKATVKVNGSVKSANRIAGNRFVAPDAVTVDSGKFACWTVTDGGNKVMLVPGQSYFMSGDIVCEPQAIGFSMLDGASVRTTEGSSGIRFMAKLNKAEYDLLTASGATVRTHILIAPTEYFDRTYGYYTVEALENAGYTDYIDIVSDGWYSETDKNYYYVGSLANILPENYTMEYSGVAYIEITYLDGTTVTAYADYDESVNSRSVYQVAHAAYNDRTTVQNIAAYPHLVNYNGIDSYSPYNDTKRGIIKSFADRVIMLDSSKDSLKVAGSFYDAPYTVSNSFNTSTMKTDVTVAPAEGWSVSDAYGVVVDGVKLSKSEYTVSDTCSFSIDIGGLDFSSLKSANGDMRSMLLLNPSRDYNTYGAFSLNVDPTYCAVNETSSVKWEFASTFSASNAPSRGARTGEFNAVYNSDDKAYYYDLSEVKAFTFSIYSNSNATLQFNIYSENKKSDGIDYYGKKLNIAAGWNTYTVQRSTMSFSREPMGWDKITSISFTGSGWDQTNSRDTVLYISAITAYDKEIKSNGFDLPELKEAAVFALGGYYSAVNSVKYMNSLSDTNVTATELDGVYYIPMAPLADSVGMTGRYYPASDTLYGERDGVAYVYTVGSRRYTVDGKAAELQYAPIEVGDAIMFSVQDMMATFGYSQLYTDRMGLIVLSNTEKIYDEDADYNKIYTLVEACIYVRPTGDRIVEDLMNSSGGQHPYLMINNDGFEKLRYYYVMDATFRKYFDEAEKKYAPDTSNFKAGTTDFLLTDGKRLTRNVKDRTIYWAFFAKFYETIDPELSKIYAERCWIEVESGCNFFDAERNVKSWNPFHYLDTAEMAYPIAIAYDWLYDYWVKTDHDVKTEYNADNSKTGKNYNYDGTETRLSIMEDALYWLGLATTGVLPSDTTGEYVSYGYSLPGATNNWNAVCTGGTIAAGLALAGVDRYADNVKLFLEYAVGAIESGMWVYAPDGGYEEGPGYWSYGTNYLHVFLSSIDTACGTNYGVYNAPGFAHSVYFTTYLGTANTTWGFHDGGSGSADTAIAPWFAMKAQDANVNAIRRQAIENGWKASSIYDVLYFDPHLCNEIITLDTDAFYSLDDIMTFRSSWDADNCIFAGLHGGDNTASHGDLDIGNFVINVNGTFMICDLGADAYNTDGYFGNNRWGYYRKRAEGQNTLVMRPHGTSWNGTTGNAHTGINPIPDQIANAISRVQRFESGEKTAVGVVDMAVAYEQMTEGIRGIYMDKANNTVIIQDEAKFSRSMDIWWFAHTEGKITVSADGRSAIVERNGIYLYAEIVSSSASAKFSIMDAVSLDKNYVGDTRTDDGYIKDNVEKDRSGVKKLCVTVENVKELSLAVAFTVISDPESVPQRGTVYAWKDIDAWKAE